MIEAVGCFERLLSYGIIIDERWKCRIWHDPVKGTVDLFWNFTIHLKVLYFTFETAGLHETIELWMIGIVLTCRLILEMSGHGSSIR